jgi:hypothetical protein
MKCIEFNFIKKQNLGKIARVKIGYQDWLFICTGCQGCTFNKLLAGGCDYLG